MSLYQIVCKQQVYLNMQNQTNNPSEYWLVNNDIITEEKTTELTFKITDNGKISINNNKTITNITNAKSIKLFTV